MFYGKSKRIIIIKDIHSNLFEEAILVLKEDKEQEKFNKPDANQIKNIKNDYILKEAELIINNYIKDNKVQFTPPKKKGTLIKKSMTMKNLIINSALLGSIVAVAFLLIKFF